MITERRRELRREVIARMGGACACCGVPSEEFLTVDHRRRLKKQKGVSGDVWKWLRVRGYPREGFRLLCFNCHNAVSNYGQCPHEAGRAA